MVQDCPGFLKSAKSVVHNCGLKILMTDTDSVKNSFEPIYVSKKLRPRNYENYDRDELADKAHKLKLCHKQFFHFIEIMHDMEIDDLVITQMFVTWLHEAAIMNDGLYEFVNKVRDDYIEMLRDQVEEMGEEKGRDNGQAN